MLVVAWDWELEYKGMKSCVGDRTVYPDYSDTFCVSQIYQH